MRALGDAGLRVEGFRVVGLPVVGLPVVGLPVVGLRVGALVPSVVGGLDVVPPILFAQVAGIVDWRAYG
jgi:hypothetical protein